MQRIQLDLRACKDKLAELPQDFFDNLLYEKIKIKIIKIIYKKNFDDYTSMLQVLQVKESSG